jgi:hypothetical protein
MSTTATQLSKYTQGGGEIVSRISLLLDNAYPVAGYAVTPANFGLTRFKPNAAGTAVLDPVVKKITPSIVLAQVIAGNLLLSYPTGGATAAPGTPADPLTAAPTAGTLAVSAPTAGTLAVTTTPANGATPVTSTSAQPAMAGVVTGAPGGAALSGAPGGGGAITPGLGKLLPNLADASAITVELEAVGY